MYRRGSRCAGGGLNVDLDLHRPVGRAGRELLSPARLSATSLGAVIRSSRQEVRLTRGRGIARDDVAQLGVIDRLDCGQVVVDEWLAQVLAQVSACGVVVSAPHVAAPQRAVGQVLRAAWSEPLPRADALDVAEASVEQRRAALGEHGRRRGKPFRVSGATVSVVLATRRPERLRSALQQVAAQTHPRLELVLALHGDGFDPDVVRRLVAETLPRTPCRVVQVPARVRFGAVLTRATRAASGRLLAKFDDDDLYGPDHVTDLLLARAYSGAAVVGKPFEYINFPWLDRTVHRPVHRAEAYTRFVAGGTLLIAAEDLAQVGGWRPVRRGVDRALLTAVLDAGGSAYATHGLGYVYVRHGEDHTWRVSEQRLLTGVRRSWAGLPPQLGVTAARDPRRTSPIRIDLRQRDGEGLLPLRQGV